MMKRLNVLIAILVVLVFVLILGRNSIQTFLLESQLNEFEDTQDRAAGRVWDDLIRLDPDNAEYRLRRVQWLYDSGRYAEAMSAVEDVIGLLPEHAGAHGLKGRLLVATNDPEAALDSYSSAIELDEGNSLYRLDAAKASLKLASFDDAIVFANEAEELSGDPHEIHQLRADGYIGLEDFERAASELSALIAVRGAEPGLLRQRGQCYLAMGDVVRAEADMKEAVEGAPDDPAVSLALAAFYRDTGGFAKSLAVLNTVLETNPNHVQAYMERCLTQRGAGRSDAAILDLEIALGIDSENVELFVLAAETYAELQDFRSAASMANSALYLLDQSDPDRLIEILLAKAGYEIERRQPERAIQDCEQALNLIAENPDALTVLGQSYLLRGNLEDAFAEFEAALRLDEGHVASQVAMAAYYIASDRDDLALELVEDVLGREPEQGEARLLSARIMLESGRYDRAQEDITIALKNGLALDAEALRVKYRVLAAVRDVDGAQLARRASEAIETWQRDPADVELMMRVAEFLIGLDARMEALDAYACQLYRTPNAFELFGSRGDVFMDLERPELALLDYGEALKLNPNSSTILAKRAQVHVRLGNDALGQADQLKALQLAEAASDPESAGDVAATGSITNFQDLADSLGKLAMRIERDPGNLIWLSQRAELHSKMRNHERAIEDYSRLIALDSGNPNYYVRRAKHYEELEEFDGALSDYLIALERDPDHRDARKRRLELLIGLGLTEQAEREAAEFKERGGRRTSDDVSNELTNRDVPSEAVEIPKDPIQREAPETESEVSDENSDDAPSDETSENVGDEDPAPF